MSTAENLPDVAPLGVGFVERGEVPMRLPLVSVIVPVYNEASTVREILDRLLALRYPPVDFEIIVVESNSADGSRQIVEGYRSLERVRIILQEKARGKGNAVRAGLREVSGDIVIIQDADLEYRIEEYPRLLDPILNGSSDVVLGCRHVRGQRMRDIPASPSKALALNAAHWWFTLVFDMTFRVRLRDPFTMFKVFRAECVEGMSFECDRFDFDWELLGKLIRRGYEPVEIPITYKARGFEDGKKVRMFADPPTWLRACARARVAEIPAPLPRRPLDITTHTVLDVRATPDSSPIRVQ